jgi:sulfur-oxidizing protein SoxY
LLQAGTGLAISLVVRAAPAEDIAAAIASFTGGAPVSTGKVKLDIPALVENGNTVPMTVTVDSPMSATDRVSTIAIFNEKNPERGVAVFSLGPRAAKASVSTHIRLAASQKLTAIARLSDGAFWSGTVDVVVTLAACIEGDNPI